MVRFRGHRRIRRIMAGACLLAMALPALAPADDLFPPPAGRVLTYACSGRFGHARQYVVRSVVGGVVTYDITIDGAAGYAVKPLWLTGTSLYREMETKQGGKSWMTAGLENFNGLRALAIGSEYTGWVIEKGAGGGVARWSVTVTVVEERDYLSDALGKIRVTVLAENWASGDRKRTGMSYVSKPQGVVAYWRQGAESDACKLVALHDS